MGAIGINLMGSGANENTRCDVNMTSNFYARCGNNHDFVPNPDIISDFNFATSQKLNRGTNPDIFTDFYASPAE